MEKYVTNCVFYCRTNYSLSVVMSRSLEEKRIEYFNESFLKSGTTLEYGRKTRYIKIFSYNYADTLQTNFLGNKKKKKNLESFFNHLTGPRDRKTVSNIKRKHLQNH